MENDMNISENKNDSAKTYSCPICNNKSERWDSNINFPFCSDECVQKFNAETAERKKLRYN
jgi:endogenous inhibitor of DNA gyrase (YacG/DUF329 family)